MATTSPGWHTACRHRFMASVHPLVTTSSAGASSQPQLKARWATWIRSASLPCTATPMSWESFPSRASSARIRLSFTVGSRSGLGEAAPNWA